MKREEEERRIARENEEKQKVKFTEPPKEKEKVFIFKHTDVPTPKQQGYGLHNIYSEKSLPGFYILSIS